MKLSLTKGLLLALVATQIPVAITNAIPLWDRYISSPLQERKENQFLNAQFAKHCSPAARKMEYEKYKNLPQPPRTDWHETPEGKAHLSMVEDLYGHETFEECATRIRGEFSALKNHQ
jgi:hypothetical protein